ncbi:hypothetical protein Sango_2896100 [Sesamum angolense]|uniref:PGG domain-containing protein n=1 Tax=Sesamum angolense TaxID=2727404 RepID=A0AAE1VW30_9LAMI|nr:hypothetical protein Sango_2896100 [Sesamum angolense]
MDVKLFEAACSGNLEALHDVMRENGTAALLKLHLSGSVEAPLHLASMFGQVEFVREYIRLSSISANQLSQLNQDGCSPLHLASAGGHLEIVTFLLEFGKQKYVVEELCMKKDGEGRTALHFAVVNGKIDVVDVLFVHCPEAAREVTFHQESVLHLAVKHYQHEVLMFLIDQKFGSRVEDLLNMGDWEGNTILHLATANRQLQVENANGLKALDMLFVNVFNSNDVHIEETITLAGGSRSQMTPTNVPTRLQHPLPNNSSRSSSQAEDDQNAKHKWFTEVRSGIIVMASVFATMTFQVALTPPGGMWQDWGPNAATSNSSSAVPTHKPGETIVYDLYGKEFRSLMLVNTQIFFSSIATIIIMLQPIKAKSRAWQMGLFVIHITVVGITMEYFGIVRFITKRKMLESPDFLASLIIWGLIIGLALLSLVNKIITHTSRRDLLLLLPKSILKYLNMSSSSGLPI